MTLVQYFLMKFKWKLHSALIPCSNHFLMKSSQTKILHIFLGAQMMTTTMQLSLDDTSNRVVGHSHKSNTKVSCLFLKHLSTLWIDFVSKKLCENENYILCFLWSVFVYNLSDFADEIWYPLFKFFMFFYSWKFEKYIWYVFWISILQQIFWII